MNITKCDICKKEIDYKNTVNVRVGLYSRAEFCRGCAVSVVKIFKKHKFLKHEED